MAEVIPVHVRKIDGKPDAQISLAAAARRLGRHPQTLYRWIRRGILRAVRRGPRDYVIQVSDLEAVDVVVKPKGGSPCVRS